MNWNQYLIYIPDSGNLIWKDRPRSEFGSQSAYAGWKTAFVGTVAGYKSFARGRRQCILVGLLGKRFAAHRIIWEMAFGEIPKGFDIDHIDCDPWNNRLDNLRLATRSQNMMNQKPCRANKTGYKGVSWDSQRMKYRSTIKLNGRQISLGRFDTIEEAGMAYKKASDLLFGEFART